VKTTPATIRPPRVRIRIEPPDLAELYCYGCHEWLALTVEFWPAPRFWRCLACESDRQKLYAARRAFDPEWREKQITKSVRYRAFIRGLDPAIAVAEAAERRERMAAKKRAERQEAETREARREYKKAWRAA
jgi:hypothetical protein